MRLSREGAQRVQLRVMLWGCAVLFLACGCSTSITPGEMALQPTQEVGQPDPQAAQVDLSAQPAQDDPAPPDPPAPRNPPPRGPGLPPGLAMLAASVEESEAQGSHHILTLHIEHVLGYGAATPPLLSGSRLRAIVRDSQIRSAGDHGRKLLQPGSKVRLALSHSQPIAGIDSPLPQWRVVVLYED